jgi:lipopolysaccharide export system permease protein
LIIDRYISWEILRPFAAGLGLLVLVFVGYSAARYLGMAADGQLDVATAFKLIGLNTLVTLEILLPTALFFSVLSAVGRLYRDAEMYAVYASGISRIRVLESVLKFSLLIALFTGFLSIAGRPWAFRTSYELEAQAAASFDLKKMAAGNFMALLGSGYVFFAQDVDQQQGVHKRVFLYKQHNENTDRSGSELLVAETASLPMLHPGEAMQAEFNNGFNYMLDNSKKQDLTLEFKELIVRLPMQEAQERYRARAETTLTLANSTNPKDIAEYQWRITTPLATVLLALIAVPLSRMSPRQSRSRNFFIALLVYIALFSVTSVMRTWVEQDKIGAIPGLWTAYVIEIALLIVLVTGLPRLKRR